MSSTSVAPAQAAIAESGFVFVESDVMHAMLLESGPLTDWTAFASSWSRLPVDRHMADGGRYRRRRHAVYAVTPTAITREAHQPHVQSLDYNPLNGGHARWFEPIEPSCGDGPTMQTILGCARRLFEGVTTVRSWRVEVHQFRIDARADEPGRPTPEGLHRDGVDYVLVLLVGRENVASGTTSVHALDGSRLGSFTLTAPFDAALLDDARVAHGVTPIVPLDRALLAHRDVLVVTLTAR